MIYSLIGGLQKWMSAHLYLIVSRLLLCICTLCVSCVFICTYDISTVVQIEATK